MQVTSQSAAPSQCTRLPSPTVVVQLALTYWHATVLPLPHVEVQVPAFWHDTEQVSPPCKAHDPLPFAQCKEQPGPEHVCVHEAPAGQ